MTPLEIATETLYVKKGRRYVPWGTMVDRWDPDVMRVGQCRLTYCPEQGHKRAGFTDASGNWLPHFQSLEKDND